MKKLALLAIVFGGLFFGSCEAETETITDEFEQQLIEKDEVETPDER